MPALSNQIKVTIIIILTLCDFFLFHIDFEGEGRWIIGGVQRVCWPPSQIIVGGLTPPPPPLPTPVSMECSILLKGDSVKSFAPLLDGVKVSCNKGHKIVAKPKRPVYRESFNKFDIYV